MIGPIATPTVGPLVGAIATPMYLQNQMKFEGPAGVKFEFQNQPWIETGTTYLQDLMKFEGPAGVKFEFQNQPWINGGHGKYLQNQMNSIEAIAVANGQNTEGNYLQDLMKFSGPMGVKMEFQNQPWIETGTNYLQNQAVVLDDFGNPVPFLQELYGKYDKEESHKTSKKDKKHKYLQDLMKFSGPMGVKMEFQNMNAVEDVAHAGAAVAVANAHHGLF